MPRFGTPPSGRGSRSICRLFRVLAPPIVKTEVLTDRIGGRGNFPNAEAFRLWEAASLLTVQAPAGPWPRELGPEGFHLGERQVITLAHERQAVALINEVPASKFARRAGLQVLDVPGWIVLLAHSRVMPMGAAWSGLQYLERAGRASPDLTNTARATLEELARGGWT